VAVTEVTVTPEAARVLRTAVPFAAFVTTFWRVASWVVMFDEAPPPVTAAMADELGKNTVINKWKGMLTALLVPLS